MTGDARLARAVRGAVASTRTRPGLLVVGATDGTDTAVASGGRRPHPDCPPERALFEIGSVTKVFTTLLLAVAVERGEARLDHPLVDHLPPRTRVPTRDGVRITLQDLATHTSGLPRLPPGLAWDALRHRDDPYATFTQERVLHALGRTRLRAVPGTRFRYSNFGGGLLGLTLAHIARSDYESLVRDRITDPLGMPDTVVTLDVDQRTRLAPGTKRGGAPASLWTMPGLAGAGALRSTAADLLTFARAQIESPASELPADLEAAIRATHVARSRGGRLAPAMRIGLGWMLVPLGRAKLPTLWHNGGTGGYRTFLGCAPGRRLATVVLSANTRSVDRLGTTLLLELAAGAPPGRRR